MATLAYSATQSPAVPHTFNAEVEGPTHKSELPTN
jgi:hypothetical protein